MATDMLASMGRQTRIGNNTTLCLGIDSREEADWACALSEGGSEGCHAGHAVGTTAAAPATAERAPGQEASSRSASCWALVCA